MKKWFLCNFFEQKRHFWTGWDTFLIYIKKSRLFGKICQRADLVGRQNGTRFFVGKNCCLVQGTEKSKKNFRAWGKFLSGKREKHHQSINFSPLRISDETAPTVNPCLHMLLCFFCMIPSGFSNLYRSNFVSWQSAPEELTIGYFHLAGLTDTYLEKRVISIKKWQSDGSRLKTQFSCFFCPDLYSSSDLPPKTSEKMREREVFTQKNSPFGRPLWRRFLAPSRAQCFCRLCDFLSDVYVRSFFVWAVLSEGLRTPTRQQTGARPNRTGARHGAMSDIWLIAPLSHMLSYKRCCRLRNALLIQGHNNPPRRFALDPRCSGKRSKC